MRAGWVLSCLAAAALAASCGRPEPTAGAEPARSADVKAAPSADAKAASSATCPPAIPVAQTLSEAVGGWEPFEDDTPTQLMSVGVFDGHPREQASLVPDSDEASAGRRTAVWQLDASSSRNYWLVCYYDRSRVALTHALARGITRVEVTRDPQATVGGLPVVTGITLK